MWNQRNLDPPPISTCRTAAVKPVDVQLLNKVIKEAYQYYSGQSILHTEAALLSRTVYRMKMKFRSSKDFKALEKLNRALILYLNMNIPKVLGTFFETTPLNYIPNKTYLPAKNMIDYILVRLQGLAKLLWRVLETCKVAAELTQKRLRLGHLWKIALISFAIVARIFVIARSMIKYTCELYGNLRPFSQLLSNSGVQWLPADYELPEFLNEWLDIDWLDLDRTVIEVPDDEPVMQFFNLIDDSDEDDDLEICDEYILIKDEPSIVNLSEDEADDDHISIIDESTLTEENSQDFISLNSTLSVEKNENIDTDKLVGFDDNVDVGEVIDLDEPGAKTKGQTKSKNKKRRKKKKAANLKTVETNIALKQGIKRKASINSDSPMQKKKLKTVIQKSDNQTVRHSNKKKNKRNKKRQISKKRNSGENSMPLRSDTKVKVKTIKVEKKK